MSPPSAEQLLNGIPDGLLACDQSGQILFVNRQAEELSGYAADELVGRHVELLVPLALRAGHERNRDEYARSGFPPRAMGSHLDIHLRRKDGRQIAVDISLSPLQAEDGTLIVAAIRDATDRRRSERTAREQALLLELAHDCIMLRNFDDSRILFWNQGAAETYGYSRAEAVGKVSHVLLRTVFPQSLEAVDRELAETGEWEGELLHRRKDGAELVLSSRQVVVRDERGNPVSILETNRNVTEQRRTQSLVQASYEVTKAVLDQRPEGEVMQLVVAHARRLLRGDLATVARDDTTLDRLVVQFAEGGGTDEMLGRTIPADDPAVARALSERRAVTVDELAQVPAGVALAPTAVATQAAVIVPFASADRVFGILSVMRSERFTKRDCADLEQFAAAAAVALDYNSLRDELQRLAVLEDRERIARDLHDGAIQSLFSVGMSLQAMAARSSEPDLAQRAQAAVDEIDTVIRDLRSYIFGLRPALLAGRQIEEALRRLVSEFESWSGVSTALDIDSQLAARLGPHETDVLKLVAEALSNAGRHAQAQTCRVSLRREGEAALLEVDDDGQGFDVSKTTGDGQGLRNFGERAGKLGGRLELTSAPGEGTTLRVWIPV